MQTLIFIALGGSIGALSRYGISKFIGQIANSPFPWGTLFINLTGSFLIGFFFELFDSALIPPNYRNLIIIGFLGAYTTFSTYSIETLNLLRGGEWKLGLINVLFSNILGILLVVLGMFTAKVIFRFAK